MCDDTHTRGERQVPVNWINADHTDEQGEGFTSYVRPERPWPADKVMQTLREVTAVRTGRHGRIVGYVTNHAPVEHGLDSWNPEPHDNLEQALQRLDEVLGSADAVEEVQFL